MSKTGFIDVTDEAFFQHNKHLQHKRLLSRFRNTCLYYFTVLGKVEIKAVEFCDLRTLNAATSLSLQRLQGQVDGDLTRLLTRRSAIAANRLFCFARFFFFFYVVPSCFF